MKKSSLLVVFVLICWKSASSHEGNKNEATSLRFQSRLERQEYMLARSKIDNFKEKFAEKVAVHTGKAVECPMPEDKNDQPLANRQFVKELFPKRRLKRKPIIGDKHQCPTTIDGSTAVIPENTDDGTELSANRHLADELFESDMLLNVEQIEQISAEYDSRKMRRRWKRKVIIGDKYRWPTKTINYKFSWNDRNWQNSVKKGLRLWERNTCLRFQENNAAAGDYLSFINYRGCSSHVGRQGGSQGVSIANGCTRIGIVAHEVGHALGYWHEQSRPDRDSYIDINFAYIRRDQQYNFSPHSAHYKDHPYDYGSVMHYGPKGFTTDWSKRTIDTRDPLYANTIGQRAALSFTDIKQINDLYCNDVCRTRLRCKHGGYPDPNNCYRCKCPDGLGGNCDRVASSASRCGGELRAGYSYKFLRPPRVFANQECYWRITAPQGRKLRFKLTSVKTHCQDTCYNYVELKFNKDFRKTGPRFCCKAPAYSIVSHQSEIIVIFRTDKLGKSSWNGFDLRYKIDGGWLTTTTRRPTTTKRPAHLSWGKWTRCSLSCGGCGIRARYRYCSKNSGYPCRMFWEEQRQSCGHRPCNTRRVTTTTTTRRPSTRRPTLTKLCHASLYAPCRYINRFTRIIGLVGDEGISESNPVENIWVLQGKMVLNSWLELDPDDPVVASGVGLIGKRLPFRAASKMCSRTVYYRCARDYLAFDLPGDGEKEKSKSPVASGAPCCHGYRVSRRGDRCVKTFKKIQKIGK